MVIDYRALTKITIPQTFCFPLIEDLIDCLEGSHYFSIVDLVQLSMNPDSIAKKVFLRPEGHYKSLRILFSSRNAVAVFQ